MERKRLVVAGIALVLAGAATAETLHFRANAQTAVGVVDPFQVALRPAPIRKEWILDGDPKTFAQEIAHTDDGSTQVFVWQTSAGRFHWFYDADEIVDVVGGEVFVTDASTGVERRLGPGDFAFFPQGARTTWRVPDHVRKVATLKHMLPGPIASAVRWMRYVKNWGRPAQAFAAE